MTFAEPEMFLLLAVPLALLARDWLRLRRSDPAGHPKIIRAEAGAHALRLAPAAGSAAHRRPSWWLLAGLALGVAALARPQWGRVERPEVERSREILIALDLSRSMNTADVKPSRLARAKLLVQSLLDHLQGERVGLLDFAGTAFVQAPLSVDYDILRDFLPSLGTDTMPVGGTNYGAMLDAAAGVFGRAEAEQGPGPAADRFLVVLSDGGATDDDWRSHVERLRGLGVRVIGLGVGTAAGALIPDGAGGYLKDEHGAVVLSPLDSSTLRELAADTGGAYRAAGGWVDIPALLQATVGAGRRGNFVERNRIAYVERFQWALAPALLCLLMSFWLEFPVRPKSRDLRFAPAPGRTAKAAGAAAAAMLALLLAAPGQARADEAGTNPGAPLGRVVGRLAGQAGCSARDWKEMAQDTVAWGQGIKDLHQPVPGGPIDDALAAVDNGSAMDPGLTDWPALRSELQALRQNPPPPKRPPPQPKPQPQPQQQQQQQQRQSGGSSQSGLGGMQPPSAPRSDDDQTQRVGGAVVNPPPSANTDSSLIVPLEKLDKVRNDDSPARLFEMLENNEPHPPTTKGKDW